MARTEALRLVGLVGIPNPEASLKKYPHEFSGGQRQRLMIAMAMAPALRPDLLIADEPTTALELTVQAEVLALLKELQLETGMGVLIITHDLGVVAEIADRVVVMNGGEGGDRRDQRGLPQPAAPLHRPADRGCARQGCHASRGPARRTRPLGAPGAQGLRKFRGGGGRVLRSDAG
ncbi:MAG: ATP-binding cassette domain-containing protein [Cereibacter changlensis]